MPYNSLWFKKRFSTKPQIRFYYSKDIFFGATYYWESTRKIVYVLVIYVETAQQLSMYK